MQIVSEYQCCFVFFLIFGGSFAASVTMTYYSVEANNDIRGLEVKQTAADAMLFTWSFISGLLSMALGILVIVTAYFTVKGLCEEICNTAVAHVEERIQSEHITVQVSEEEIEKEV